MSSLLFTANPTCRFGLWIWNRPDFATHRALVLVEGEPGACVLLPENAGNLLYSRLNNCTERPPTSTAVASNMQGRQLWWSQAATKQLHAEPREQSLGREKEDGPHFNSQKHFHLLTATIKNISWQHWFHWADWILENVMLFQCWIQYLLLTARPPVCGTQLAKETCTLCRCSLPQTTFSARTGKPMPAVKDV